MLFVWILLILLTLAAVCWMFAMRCVRRKTGFYGFAADHYAHRGLHANDKGIPENSMLAFRLAVKAGFGTELDVRLSKDGRLVIMHDDDLKRMCGVARDVRDMTAAELDECRLLGTEEKIPYLEDVLPLFAGKTPMIIEIKPYRDDYTKLIEKVCAMLHKYPDVKFCIESFDPRVLMWLKKHRPDIVRGQLSCNFFHDSDVDLAPVLRFALTNLLLNFIAKPHFVAYRLEDRNQLSFCLCRKLWGVQEINWTVKNAREAEAAMRDDRLIIFEGFLPE